METSKPKEQPPTPEMILDKHNKLNDNCLVGISFHPLSVKALKGAMQEYADLQTKELIDENERLRDELKKQADKYAKLIEDFDKQG